MQQDREVIAYSVRSRYLGGEDCRMKLTVKDKDFLERLKRLLEEKELRI